MRVLGVDPGSRVCGYGVLESQDGKLIHIESGSIAPPASSPLPQRLKAIYDGLVEVIDKCSPDVMSVEDVFFAKNPKSTLKLGEARGVAILAAVQSGLEVHEYAPTEVKLALTGHGRANKAEVQRMITSMLGIPETKRKDTSDAIAIALCHIHFSRIKDILGKDFVRPRRRRRRFRLDDIPS